MRADLATPLQCRNGSWVTIMHGPAGWGFAWRTPIMRCSAFWYFNGYREMLAARRKFIANNGGRS